MQEKAIQFNVARLAGSRSAGGKAASLVKDYVETMNRLGKRVEMVRVQPEQMTNLLVAVDRAVKDDRENKREKRVFALHYDGLPIQTHRMEVTRA